MRLIQQALSTSFPKRKKNPPRPTPIPGVSVRRPGPPKPTPVPGVLRGRPVPKAPTPIPSKKAY